MENGKLNVLELFAGSRSFCKAAEERGHNTFSSDIEQFDGIDYAVDISDFNIDELPFNPDVIWASPPCYAFSISSVRHHFHRYDNGDGTFHHEPKSETAKKGVEMVEKTIETIQALRPTYYFVENPRGLLRKLKIMEYFPIHSTVTYCQYGDERMKPTDIWHNNPYWQPRPMCKNGDDCHMSAPRGSRTGTQGRKNSFDRSKVPHELSLEVIRSCE